ncbi:hypothetical protein DVA86_34535 [Streptomyces armeniacus]|uniref:Malate synthase C-terminal domain-containing protein n=1 Tax=Streptomyces armeniacus TaxID=83291 RepID=A0A345Y1X1_9ACTN|nr:hypothetical protein DVA86_34535 [Streptomyces armeniacus]
MGAVAILGLMGDAATAGISRAQIWQWVNAGVVLDTGETVTPELVRKVAAEDLAAIRAELGDEAPRELP